MKHPNNIPIDIINNLTENIDTKILDFNKFDKIITQRVYTLNSPLNKGWLDVLLTPNLSPFKLQFYTKQFLKEFYILDRANSLNRALRFAKHKKLSILSVLESRLDVLVFRLSFAKSIFHARNLIHSGLIKVNGQIVKDIHFFVEQGSSIHSDYSLTPTYSLYSLIRPLPSYLIHLHFNKGVILRTPNHKDLLFPSLIV